MALLHDKALWMKLQSQWLYQVLQLKSNMVDMLIW